MEYISLLQGLKQKITRKEAMKKRISKCKFRRLKAEIIAADKARGWKLKLARRFKITIHALEKIIDNPETTYRPLCGNYTSLKKDRHQLAKKGKKCIFCGKCLALPDSEYCSDNCMLLSVEFRHHKAICEDAESEHRLHLFRGRSFAQPRMTENGYKPCPHMAVM